MDFTSIFTNHFRAACLGLLAVGTIAINAAIQRKKNPRGLPPPPGPKGYPLIGNLFDMPRFNEYPWYTLEKMRYHYGDMIYFEVLGQPILVLGTIDKVEDILEKRSSIYSGRPDMPMIKDLMGWKWNFGLLSPNSKWKKDRRAFHDHFNQGVVSKYRPIMLQEARVFLRLLTETPADFQRHIRHTFSAIVMRVTYGIEVPPNTENVFASAGVRVLKAITDSSHPGTFLVDLIPAMKYIPSWFPGAGFQRTALAVRRLTNEFLELPFDYVKEAMRTGDYTPCVLASLLEASNDEKSKVDEETAKHVSAMAFTGGSDTTASVIETFFLAMAMFPAVQKKAQEELDRVLGGERLPVFEDRPFLPYINAVVKECLRWQLVGNLGVPRSVTEDDEYNGYFIPKGTIVMANAWAILHDPEVYEEPEAFMPERYLKNGQLNPEIRDPSVAAFGYGRRICPGRFFSDQNLFILIASTLSTLDILAPLGDDGKPRTMEAKYTSTPSSGPSPFECRIKARSTEASYLIQHSVAA